MKKRIIPREEVEEMVKELEEACEKGERAWDEVYKKYSKRRVLIEFPLGEIMNPKIAGFVWAWSEKKVIRTEPITEKDKFIAHKTEGKASIPVSLDTALLVWRELPKYRRQIVEIIENDELSP